MIAPQLTENYSVEKILHTPFDDITPFFSAIIYKIHSINDIKLDSIISRAKIECNKYNSKSKRHYFYFDEIHKEVDLAVMTIRHKSVPTWLSGRNITKSIKKSFSWEDYCTNLVIIYISNGYMFINCQEEKALNFFQITLSKLDASIVSPVAKTELQKTRAFRGKEIKIVSLKNTLGQGGGSKIPESKSYTGLDCSKSLNSTTDHIFRLSHIGATDKENGYSGASLKKGKVWASWTDNIDNFITICDEYAFALNSIIENENTNLLKCLAKPTSIKLKDRKPLLFSLDSYKRGKGVLGLKYESKSFKSWNTDIPTHENDKIIFQMWLDSSEHLECRIKFSFDESNLLTFEYAETNEHEPNVVFFGEDAVEPRGRDLVKYLNSCKDYTFLFPGGVSYSDDETFVVNKLKNCFFGDSITEITWDNVDITKEDKLAQSPQINILQRLERFLTENKNMSFGINDNGANEVADLVVLLKDRVLFVHAKYSKKPTPGLRIADLQEVASQAIKNVNFADIKAYSEKHLERLYNNKFYNPEGIDIEEFKMLYTNALEDMNIRKEVWIVQPGILKRKLEDNPKNKAHTLLSYVELILNSAQIDFKFFCSS